MTYNAKIHHEQGGSVLTVQSGGSITLESGGKLNSSGDLSVSGSLTIADGGVLLFGSIAQFIVAASTTGPAGGPVNALPGSIFIRTDGSVSNLYINTGIDGAGSVWSTASIDAP